MSAKDVIALNAHYEAWVPKLKDVTDIDPWLYYCVEQFMKPYAVSDEDIQACIFAHNALPLAVYLICVKLIKKIESFLKKSGMGRKDVTNIRFYVAMVLAIQLTGEMAPTAEKVVSKINPNSITDKQIKAAFEIVLTNYESLSEEQDRDDVARGSELLETLLGQLEGD